ncbi:MAG TPA: AAA family ATPase [Bryobacteraceae bacterium]|nr:AAA family ATPase [Bryobacteraceae bacterium]
MKKNNSGATEILTKLAGKVIGQPQALSSIVPFVHMYNAGLSPEGRPVGVFLLLGPTGTGKTRTVEALAEVLHGSRKHMVRVDCGEYQLDHEVAKLIGAPPGYLGHRETHPILTQSKLAAVTSEKSSLSIILFDEIEKAAPSLNRLLLGVLDKASLRLGDNNVVNFERSLIFLTSNLGAHGMMKELSPGFGFASDPNRAPEAGRLENIAMAAVRRNFSPEFVNRIDAAVTYQPLSTDTLTEILAQQLNELQNHIENRLGSRGFRLTVTARGRDFLLKEGSSAEYGARELKRAIHQKLTQPLAELVVLGRVKPGGSVRVDYDEKVGELRLKAAA